MIFIRLLSVNKTNCSDFHREFSYEILNFHYLCTFLTSGNSIRLRQNFARSRIFAGFGENAGFWPEPEQEPDSGAAQMVIIIQILTVFEGHYFSMLIEANCQYLFCYITK